jgi:hypothetical protein
MCPQGTGTPVNHTLVLCARVIGREFLNAEQESGRGRSFRSYHKVLYISSNLQDCPGGRAPAPMPT